MIYEATLDEGETREDYLARFRRVNRPAWSFLSDEEWAEIDHHVTTSEYPETSANWIRLGREAVFADARELFCDPTGFYRITATTSEGPAGFFPRAVARCVCDLFSGLHCGTQARARRGAALV
jgi:hypothetical protein